jgi:hypothetical protein
MREAFVGGSEHELVAVDPLQFALDASCSHAVPLGPQFSLSSCAAYAKLDVRSTCVDWQNCGVPGPKNSTVPVVGADSASIHELAVCHFPAPPAVSRRNHLSRAYDAAVPRQTVRTVASKPSTQLHIAWRIHLARRERVEGEHSTMPGCPGDGFVLSLSLAGRGRARSRNLMTAIFAHPIAAGRLAGPSVLLTPHSCPHARAPAEEAKERCDAACMYVRARRWRSSGETRDVLRCLSVCLCAHSRLAAAAHTS